MPEARSSTCSNDLPEITMIDANGKRVFVAIMKLDGDELTIVSGVSFGGIVARELASSINAKACILISSVRSPDELPPWFRVFRALRPRTAEMGMSTIGVMSS